MRAGLAMSENGLGLKRRQIKQPHGNSEATSSLETFKGNSPKNTFYWFYYSGSTFKCLDRRVAVGIGLAIAL
jgi:hypothetical protein